MQSRLITGPQPNKLRDSTYDQISACISVLLAGLYSWELFQVAKNFGLKERFATKRLAVLGIQHKIFDRKASFERCQFRPEVQ